MLLHEENKIVIRSLRAQPHTGRVILDFYVERRDGKSPMGGPEVVHKLKEKLKQDSGILQLSVANIDTTICQNNCSGICRRNVF